MSKFLGGFNWASDNSFDFVFKQKKLDLRKISSLDKLADFIRVSESNLISKADKDLWKVEEDAEGNLVVYRLFEHEKSPLKG